MAATDEQRVASLLESLAPGLTEQLQASLQGPTPSVGYEVRGQFNDHRYEDRQGFEGFAVRLYVTRVG